MKKIIIVNKKTFYEFCFLDKAGAARRTSMRLSREDIARFTRMHRAHHATLAEVQRVLDENGLFYRVSHRKAHIDYSKYDFVITVGGDGTFLQAARHVRHQPILGVNSDPERSVGKFCAAHKDNFREIFERILACKKKPVELTRLSLSLKGTSKVWLALNDILICDVNPAAMSRYVVTIEGYSEEQRSSGLWVATASGSTGAIHSSGAKVLPKTSPQVLYRPRELYCRYPREYRLTGQALRLLKAIRIRSLMRNGVIYIDGAHFKIPFSYGDVAVIRRAPSFVRSFA